MQYGDIVSKYSSNVAILKYYRHKKKLTLHNTLIKSGFENTGQKKIYRKKGTVNNEKLENNIVRAKSKIFELAYCNEWDLFITLTINPNKYDRYNLKKYHKELSQWIRDYNKKYGLKIKYLLIPEMHKNGAWHMHGLIMGLPSDHLQRNEYGYLDWLPYKNKFGWCSIDNIKNNEAVSKYITKYINKSLAECVKELNAHMYYCSQGLKKAIELKRGALKNIGSIDWDYKNDWISVKWLENTDNTIEFI